MNAKRKVYLQDKTRGCLLGGAIGDALGYAIEFDSEPRIFSRYGETGITEYRLEPYSGKALISDDTQMTLFTAYGLMAADCRRRKGERVVPRDYITLAYLDWFRTQNMSFRNGSQLPSHIPGGESVLLATPELYSRRAPGNTCLSALSRLTDEAERRPDYIAEPMNGSKGCGSVMRVAPVGLDSEFLDIKEMDWEAAQAGAITHGHPLGYMPCAVLAHIIHRLLFDENSMSLKEIILEARDTTADLFAGNEYLPVLTDLIDLAVELAESEGTADLDNIHRLGEGWIAEEALAIAIYCALRHQDDFSAGIIASVNHKGDSDSTGAITGNILGALLGADRIEEKWLRDLELKDVIISVADDMVNNLEG